ncbi:MAG: glycine cleavage system protein H [Pirellulales bacterium]
MAEVLETTVDKFIFRVATGRLYGPEGVWVLEEGDRVRVGVTDYLQQLNGDVTFVHLKPPETSLAMGDEFAEVETIKATVSLYAPLKAKVVAINGDLERAPETINQDPYGKGWLAVLEPTDWRTDRAKLLTAEVYLSAMRSQAERELED